MTPHSTSSLTMRPRRPMLLIGFVALLFGASSASATDPATLANNGSGSIAPCSSCHGKDGAGMATFPRLAGMDATYLNKQLQDFASGSRSNPVMAPIATALSAEDAAALADYYSKMPVPAALAHPKDASADDGGLGARLALYGKWSAKVPACIQCHGPQGVGVGGSFPAIAGQTAAYLTAQLTAFKQGTRKNDPDELMRHIPAALSEEEINAVAQWFAGVPVTPTGKPTARGGRP